MYLGRIVEQGPAREVIRDPRHPYTKALLSVVPSRDPGRAGTPRILTGETPDPARVPSGCRFHPRCPVAEDRCAAIDPPVRQVTAGHSAACLLAGAAQEDDSGC
jgi:oligopeptide/dipeptide ABC transporter ATP-binding protein